MSVQADNKPTFSQNDNHEKSGGGGGGFSCFACLGKRQRTSATTVPPTANGNHLQPTNSSDDVTNTPNNVTSQLEDDEETRNNGNCENVDEKKEKLDNDEGIQLSPEETLPTPEEKQEEKTPDVTTASPQLPDSSPSTTSPSSLSAQQQLTTAASSSSSSNSCASPPPPPLPPSNYKAATAPPPSITQPLKAAFFVSFMVDARGGAMTGGRGSGLRLIMPQGAVEQPVRVTCRYLKEGGVGMHFPPPLMEREALASRVIEVGPAGTAFKAPVLIEVPHFASLRQGERELVVLRSDDGETWQEHTTAFYSSWESAEDQENDIYQDFRVNSEIGPAFEVLATDRVVRISTKVFPHYFAILSRVKEEVRVMGYEGGKVSAAHTPQLQVYFPPQALLKRIKVALQIQTVPDSLISLVYPPAYLAETAANRRTLRASPLVALDPRRRRFHCPVQVMVPLPKKAQKMTNRRIRLLCSLTGPGVSRANWEDVTDATPLVSKKDDCIIVFETKVSALFWVLAIDDDPLEEEEEEVAKNNRSSGKYEDVIISDERDKVIGRVASVLYEELVLPPYMARILVLHKPHAPHAWLDTLLVFCVTDDKADLAVDSKNSALVHLTNSTSLTLRSIKPGSPDNSWKLLVQTEEMELPAGSLLKLELDRSMGNLVVAQDAQFEFGYRQSLTFVPFRNNCCTLLVRAPVHGKPKRNQLKVSKVFNSTTKEGDSSDVTNPSSSMTSSSDNQTNQQSSVLCTLDINLDGEESESNSSVKQQHAKTEEVKQSQEQPIANQNQPETVQAGNPPPFESKQNEQSQIKLVLEEKKILHHVPMETSKSNEQQLPSEQEKKAQEQSHETSEPEMNGQKVESVTKEVKTTQLVSSLESQGIKEQGTSAVSVGRRNLIELEPIVHKSKSFSSGPTITEVSEITVTSGPTRTVVSETTGTDGLITRTVVSETTETSAPTKTVVSETTLTSGPTRTEVSETTGTGDPITRTTVTVVKSSVATEGEDEPQSQENCETLELQSKTMDSNEEAPSQTHEMAELNDGTSEQLPLHGASSEVTSLVTHVVRWNQEKTDVNSTAAIQ